MNEDKIRVIQEKLSQIENKYNVQEWILNDIQYWPVLKNIIYFRDRKTTNNLLFSIINSPRTVINKIKNKIKNKLFSSTLKSDDWKYEETDIIFSAAITHRVIYKEKYFNRYFDPIMDELANNYSTKLFEYSLLNSKYNYYKKERIKSIISEFIKISSNSKIEIHISDEVKKNIKIVSDIFILNSDSIEKEFRKKIITILYWKIFWNNVILKCKPKLMIALCYYNEPMYAMLLAANENNIPTVDMQHGGQGSQHPSYTFNDFKKGFNTLPKYFWVWDDISYNHIVNFTKDSNHDVINGGNPWINFLLDKKENIILKKNIKHIVCTLTLGNKQILPNYLVDAIKKATNEYMWLLRWHPRTSDFEKNKLIEIIKKEQIQDKTNIEEANDLALPILLNNAWAHISHSSGSISEADIIKVPINIVTSELGCLNYKELLEKNRLHYFNPELKTNLFSFLCRLNIITNDDNIKESNNNIKIINEIIKKN